MEMSQTSTLNHRSNHWEVLYTVLLNDVAVLRLWSKSLKINCEKIYFFSKVTARSQVLLYTAYALKVRKN